MQRKEPYTNRCFALPVEQVKYHFGLPGADHFVYAVKRDGDLVSSRERLRPEWE
mgnify:CR=1 FL=1